MTDVDEYMATTVTPVVIQKGKAPKRKRDTESKTHDTDELRKKARLYCSCAQQWRSVSRYSSQRMTEFVEEREFDQQKELYTSVFGFLHQLWALTMDKIAMGNGHVATEIENDVSLRQAIEVEGAKYIQFLTHRWRLVALTSVDIFNGKKHQLLADPPSGEASIEEIDGDARGGEANCEAAGHAQLDAEAISTEAIDQTTGQAIDEDVNTQI